MNINASHDNVRTFEDQKLYCLVNFSGQPTFVTWFIFEEHGPVSSTLYDHWQEKECPVGIDHEYVIIEPYEFCLMEQMQDY